MGLSLSEIALEAVPIFCFGYPFVMSWFWMIGAALYWIAGERRWRRLDQPPELPSLPPISIIVPCHNEADNAAETFAALAAIDYPDYEVIAVDDGSRDNTGAILDRLAAAFDRMRVVHLKTNEGKATAMNIGALLARHQLLVLIDGDALLDPFALRWIAWTFARADIGALTGNPRIRNRTSILGRMQVGEFSSIIGLIKRTHATYGRMFTVSGVICAFRKRVLHDAGWWSPHTLTDDVDVTWRVQRAGWRIAYQPNAIVWILMPETLRGLWRQRLRWAEGGGQMLIDNALPMLRFESPTLLPVYFDAAASILWAYCVLATILVGALHGLGVPILPQMPTFSLIPEWYELTLCLTFLLQAVVSAALESRLERRFPRMLFWVIWYPLVFWTLNALTAALALPRALTRPRHARGTWISPDRGLR